VVSGAVTGVGSLSKVKELVLGGCEVPVGTHVISGVVGVVVGVNEKRDGGGGVTVDDDWDGD